MDARPGHTQWSRNLADFIHLLIERDIKGPVAMDEVLGPFRQQMEESGMTDDELGAFFEEVRS